MMRDLLIAGRRAASARRRVRQAVLAILIEAAQNREAAAIRLRDAKEAVREAMRAEADALAAHQAANPPPSAIDAHRAAIAAFNKANS